MADENLDDIVTKPKPKQETLDTATPQDTPTPKADASTDAPVDNINNNKKVDAEAVNDMGSGHPLDPNNSALGDSMWLGMDDSELEAEAGRRKEADDSNEKDFPNLNSSLSGLDNDGKPTNKQGNDTPANKGANTSVLDRLNAANGKTEEVEAQADNKDTANKGANTSVLDRLNAANSKTEEVKAQVEQKDEFNIDDILAAAKQNHVQVNNLKASASAEDSVPKGPAPKPDAPEPKQGDSSKKPEDKKPDDDPELDNDEEFEYDEDGNRIVRINGRRVNADLGAKQSASSPSQSNSANTKPVNHKAAKNDTAPGANNPNNQTPAPPSNKASQTPAPKPTQNSAQPANQPQNGGSKPGGAVAQGGNAPSGGGGGGGGRGTTSLGQNLNGLISNTVGLAKNTVGVAALAVGAIPDFANSIKTSTSNLAEKSRASSADTPTPAATATPSNTPTTRVPIPTSNIPTVNTPKGAPLTNPAANQASYDLNSIRPLSSGNKANPANTGMPANNNLAPGQKLNLQQPLPQHQNLTPVKNNVIPISAAQNKTAPITPATAAKSATKPTNNVDGAQFMQNLAQKSKQKQQGLFAGLPADNPMHNLPSTTKQAMEDAHNARNTVSSNLESIEKDKPIGSLRDKKQKSLNDGFRNYTDSSEAANELLKNSKKSGPADREASLEATKYLDGMNKDVSKNTDTAKDNKLLDKDNATNLKDKMKGIVESTKKIMESIKATIESVAKLFSGKKPKP